MWASRFPLFYILMISFPVWRFLPDWSMFLREKSCSKGTKFCAVRVDSHWEGRQNEKWQLFWLEGARCSYIHLKWQMISFDWRPQSKIKYGWFIQVVMPEYVYPICSFILENCQIDNFFVHDGMLAYSWSCYSHVFRYTELDLVIWGLN